MKANRTLLFVLLLILTLAAFYERGYLGRRGDAVPDGGAAIARAFEERLSNVQIEGDGIVDKVLKDDVEGRRHQRVVVRVGDDLTVLIAHNIDLAPRLESVERGDRLEFFGEYEWNSKGGVIHWTHRDPDRRHVDGWLRHRGRLYQ